MQLKGVVSMNNEDKDMMRLVDRFVYDEKIQLLEDITIEETNLNDEQRKRIKAGVMKQIRLASFKKLMKAGILAASVTICVLLSALTPLGRKTLAAIAEKLYFIPGLGKAEMNQGTDIYILPKPIESLYNESTFSISSITKNSNFVTINMSGDYNSGATRTMQIEDEIGNRYNSIYSSIGLGNGWVGVFSFDIPENLNHFNIVFSDDYKIPVTLVKAESYEDYSTMGPIDVCNNLGLTLVPTILNNKIRFDLIQHPYNDSQISLYGKSDKEAHEHVNILINDENNKSYSVEYPETHIGTLSYFNFTPDSKSTKYTIQIPEVTLKYSISNKLTIPMPKEGSTEVNKVLDLQGFPLKITHVIREGDYVKVFIDTSYDENKPENMNNVILDMDAMSINYFKWNLNDQITTESFEFYIKPKDKKLTIKFKEMYTVLKGPWVFEISTDNSN